MNSIDLNISMCVNNDDIINKKYTYNNIVYNVIKYNKEQLKEYEKNNDVKFTELSKYRSVVIRDQKVVVYSPAKSINIDTFKKSKYSFLFGNT